MTRGWSGVVATLAAGGTAVAVLVAAPARPVKLSPAGAAAVMKEIEKDRVDTQKWLQSDPTSYLATPPTITASNL